MRKQDRITNQQRNRPQESSNKEPQQPPREQVKGGASEMQRPPQRQSGTLPLPD